MYLSAYGFRIVDEIDLDFCGFSRILLSSVDGGGSRGKSGQTQTKP